MKKDELIRALSFLTEMLARMTEEEFRALQQGKLQWALPEEKAKREKPPSVQASPAAKEVAEFLSACRDEAEARSYLASHPALKTKPDLLALGRALKAPVTTKHRKEELIQIIARHTVGRRLQSEAISRVTGHE